MIGKISDICSAVYSGGTPNKKHSEYYEDAKIPWLNTGEIAFNRIRSTEKFISDEGLRNSSAKWVPENTVIVAMYGATAARTAITKIPLTTNQACCNLIIDENKADYRYVYYWLYNQYTHLASLANGGAQQNLNVGQIKDYPIDILPLEIQKKIADILSTLDDKIEMNNQINRNLSEQAQALYEEMIVDAADETWVPGILSDVADITMGQSPKGDTYNEEGEGTVFYQGRAEFGDRFPTRRLFTTVPKRMAQVNDVLLSVRAPVGDLNVAYESCCIGRGLGAIHSNNDHQSYVLYTMMALNPQLDRFNGEGTVFGSINRDALNKMELLIPPVAVMDSFENVVAPMDEAIRKNYEENRRLISLRDSLLPKLMSGELDVSELDI